VTDRPRIRSMLARGFDPDELRRIKRLDPVTERFSGERIWFDRGPAPG
jgi:hypothetical protein